jgi:hypothetical protein
MHAKTALKVVRCDRRQKNRAKSSESAIIIRTTKRAGEILRDYYLENVYATVK